MDTRHRRHWCLIADQLGHEPWTNDQVATIVRLITHMHERWARDGLTSEEANTCVLTLGHLVRITGKPSFDAAMQVMHGVSERVSLSVERLSGDIPCVYFAHYADRIKIGCTGNMETRIATLRRRFSPLTVLARIETYEHFKLERQIHREFADLNIEGEWFRDDPRIRAYATAHATLHAHDTSATRVLHAHYMYSTRSARAISPNTRCVVVSWPKFAEFQRLTGPFQSHNGPKSEPPVPVPVPEPEKDTPPTPSERGPWPSIEALVELYNRTTPDECPAVETLSEGRRKKIRAYLKQFPTEQFWQECFDEIHRSPFLRGLKNRNGHHNFVADLDWLLQKGLDGTENCVKTHDGKYREA